MCRRLVLWETFLASHSRINSKLLHERGLSKIENHLQEAHIGIIFPVQSSAQPSIAQLVESITAVTGFQYSTRTLICPNIGLGNFLWSAEGFPLALRNFGITNSI